jgi:hypothetical protein
MADPVITSTIVEAPSAPPVAGVHHSPIDTAPVARLGDAAKAGYSVQRPQMDRGGPMSSDPTRPGSPQGDGRQAQSDTATPPAESASDASATQSAADASPEAPLSAREGAPEVEADKDPADAKLSARFAALSRRERKVREQEAAIKEQKQKLDVYEQGQRLARENPLALLEALGIQDPYQHVTDWVLKQGKPTVQSKLQEVEAKLQALEETRAREAQAAQDAQVQRTLDGFRRDLRAHIDGNASAYELITAEGAHDEVYALIEAECARSGKVMPFDVAARLVEDQLFEEAKRLTKATKLAKLFAPAPQAGAATDSDKKAGVPVTPRPVHTDSRTRRFTTTLTNARVASAPPAPGERRLTREERLAKSAALIRWRD